MIREAAVNDLGSYLIPVAFLAGVIGTKVHGSTIGYYLNEFKDNIKETVFGIQPENNTHNNKPELS